MFNLTLKRSVMTLAVAAGLLVAASPAGAQGGGADFTRFQNAPIIKPPVLDETLTNLARGGKLHLDDISLGVTVDAGSGDDKVRTDGVL